MTPTNIADRCEGAEVFGSLEAAIACAAASHFGQVDKGGEPYILHPLRVMLAVKGDIERKVAVLHDTVEDTALTFADIRRDFGWDVADAVNSLTKADGEDYAAFIDRVAQNRVATVVKLADLAYNMDVTRLGREPTNEDARRMVKYGEARNVLYAALRALTPRDNTSEGE